MHAADLGDATSAKPAAKPHASRASPSPRRRLSKQAKQVPARRRPARRADHTDHADHADHAPTEPSGHLFPIPIASKSGRSASLCCQGVVAVTRARGTQRRGPPVAPSLQAYPSAPVVSRKGREGVSQGGLQGGGGTHAAFEHPAISIQSGRGYLVPPPPDLTPRPRCYPRRAPLPVAAPGGGGSATHIQDAARVPAVLRLRGARSRCKVQLPRSGRRKFTG